MPDYTRRPRGTGALAPAAALFLLASVSGCGRKAPRQAAAAALPRPNVVLVLVDTLRARDLELYGYERQTAPNLAAFARQAYLFEDAHAQAPCTFPSVNSILTSRPPLQFVGQPDDRMGIPEGVPTLPEILRVHGYSTAAISASPIVRRSPSNFNPHGGFERGFDRFNEACAWKPAPCLNRRVKRLLPHLPEPFFLYLHYMDVHGPYRPPANWTKRFAGRALPEYSEGVAGGDPNPLEARLAAGADPGTIPRADVAHLHDLYDEEIAYFDSQFRHLLGQLRARGLLERTLFVFLADHGEQFLEHGHLNHCQSIFEPEIHVPLILRLPAELERSRPRRLAVPAANLDVLPTILDYLEIKAPASLVGTSLRPAIEGNRPPVDPTVFASWGGLRAAVDGRFKLVFRLGNGERKLFDLDADPDETHDVLAEHPRVAHRLTRELAHWIRDVEGGSRGERGIRADQQAIERLRALGYLQ